MRDKDGKIIFLAPQLASEINLRLWDNIPNNTKAIILTTFGSGSIPSNISKKINERVRKGTPVFLINSVENTANDASFGIPALNYETQIEALEAGAIHLESVNMGHQKRTWEGDNDVDKNDVIKTIEKLADESNDMFDLIDEVRKIYNLTDSEIDFLVEQTQENSAPISKDKIMSSRRLVDAMLNKLKTEMGSEAQGEIKMKFPR